jgi:hypothetical protein
MPTRLAMAAYSAMRRGAVTVCISSVRVPEGNGYLKWVIASLTPSSERDCCVSLARMIVLLSSEQPGSCSMPSAVSTTGSGPACL